MKAELAAMMRAAWNAGFSVIPVGANKRPAIAWAERIHTRCELDVLLMYEAMDVEGYGICGGGPERLVFFDFEAGFDFHAFAELLRDAGLFDLFESWLEDYQVGTPGQGIHTAVRLDGSDPVPGNTKLAFDSSGKVTAELRGDGGFTVGPGSNGRTHPNGGYWILARGGFESIPYVTIEQFNAVCAVIATMCEAPLAPADRGIHLATGSPSSAGGVSLAELERGSSYLDEAREAMPRMSVVLESHGWVLHHEDHEYGYWTRPGKDPREGVSATINHSDRLFVFSSNAFPVPASPGRQTYSVIDVLAFYQGVSGGDIVREFKPQREWSSPAVAADLVLPESFWSARPYLAHVYDAALSGFIPVSPDLLWMAVKTIYAASIPWNFRLPGNGTFDYIGLMVGASGSGKTSARDAALDLLPQSLFQIEGINLMLPPGSGEGLAEHFIERDKGGRQVRIWPRGASFYVDEGKWLFDVASRSGNTTIQALKQMYTGHHTGTLAATGDRHRVIPPRAIRASFLISIQPGQAARFLRSDLEDEGLPQRVAWAVAQHPDIDDVEREHPGPLDIPTYDMHAWGGASEPSIVHTIRYEESLRHEIRSRAIRHRRDGVEALEGHADIGTLKTAAIHALLRGERNGPSLPEVTREDWDLARSEWEASRRVRNWVLANSKESANDGAVAAGRIQAVRWQAEHDVHLEAAAAVVRNKLTSAGPLQIKAIKDALGSRYRKVGIGHRDAIEYALARRWIVVHSDGGYAARGDG